jgi:hypothetical protein
LVQKPRTGNGSQLPKASKQVPDEKRLRELEYLRRQHEVDANAGVRSDMVGPRRKHPNQVRRQEEADVEYDSELVML